MPTRPRPNWPGIRAFLWERSGGICEVSGRPLNPDTFDAHHRRPKGMGGTSRPDTDTLPNLLALDPIVHNGQWHSVHQWPYWSRPRGYLLPKHLDEHAVRSTPVWYRSERWALLTPDGGLILMTGIDAPPEAY